MKKIIKITTYLLTAFMLMIIFSLVYAGTKAVRNNEIVTLFNRGYSVVMTDSMEPTIQVGEFIIVKTISYDEAYRMVENDEDPVLVYKSSRGIHIVHRAIDISDGSILMKGDNPKASVDSELVTQDNLVGIVIGQTMAFGLGKLLVNSRSLIFLVAILAFVVLLVMEISSIFKQVKERNEMKLNAQFEAEKERIISEEKERLRKELEEELKKEDTTD